MEEQTRRVRAHSDNTGRPYFTINYKLSLSGRDLLSQALDEGNLEVIEFDNGEATPPMPPAPMGSSTAQRRSSDLDPRQKLNIQTADLLFSQKAPSTPSSQHRKKLNGFGRSDPPPPPPVLPDVAAPPGTSVRRTKSASTMQDMELNRTAPPVAPFSTAPPMVDQNMLPGFVTCLNSRNVAKYKVGQRYRDGVVVGIDDDHGKIIVYNENLPRGALTVLRTQNAARYDRGFVLEDVRGGFLGSVHALDRIQNLLVLNTSPNPLVGGGVGGGEDCREIVPPAAIKISSAMAKS